MRQHTILSATLLLALSAACPACSDDATATDASVTDAPVADVVTQDVTADRPDVTAPADAAADVVAQDAATDRPDVTAPADVASDVATTDTGCAPLANNLSANGMRCTPSGSECPAGYACTVTSGVVASYACEIRCRMDCECPSGSVCGTFTDKAGPRRRCE